MTPDVSYFANRTVDEIEEGVTSGELPDAVKAQVRTDYPRGKIAKAKKKTVATIVTYELKVTSAETSLGVKIDPSSKVLKKSKDGAEKDKSDRRPTHSKLPPT